MIKRTTGSLSIHLKNIGSVLMKSAGQRVGNYLTFSAGFYKRLSLGHTCVCLFTATQAIQNSPEKLNPDPQSMTSSHSKEQGQAEYKQSIRQWEREQETESQRWAPSQGKVEQPLSFHCCPHLISVLGSHSTSSMCVCVCVLWLISVRGKWKPLISHLSPFRKSCHSLRTRCHLHSFNQDLSHCLTCSCARILIWGL